MLAHSNSVVAFVAAAAISIFPVSFFCFVRFSFSIIVIQFVSQLHTRDCSKKAYTLIQPKIHIFFVTYSPPITWDPWTNSIIFAKIMENCINGNNVYPNQALRSITSLYSLHQDSHFISIFLHFSLLTCSFILSLFFLSFSPYLLLVSYLPVALFRSISSFDSRKIRCVTYTQMECIHIQCCRGSKTQ